MNYTLYTGEYYCMLILISAEKKKVICCQELVLIYSRGKERDEIRLDEDQ
jgi:hypothetical protein